MECHHTARIRYLLLIFPIIFLMLADIIIFYAARLGCQRWPPPIPERLTSLAIHGILAALSVVCLVQLAWRDFQVPLAIDFEDQATAKMYRLLDMPFFDGKRVRFGPSCEFTGTWIFGTTRSFRSSYPRANRGRVSRLARTDGDQLYPSLTGDDQASLTQSGRRFGVLAWRRCADIPSETGKGDRLPADATVQVHPHSRALAEAQAATPTCILPTDGTGCRWRELGSRR
jgi:hypothetical protein